MERTVSQMSRLCGVSVRTLHHYGQIGLLLPSSVTPSGYRMYDDTCVARLQQILFFRELGFSLNETKQLLDSPAFDPHQALKNHRALLTLRKQRLERLIRLVDDTLKGENTMNFDAFDQSGIELAKNQYAKEAKERWGSTNAWKESQQKTIRYQKEDWVEINAEAEEIFRGLASCMNQPAGSAEANKWVALWQQHITQYFYTCTDEILAGLGEMYVQDPRFTQNLDQYAPGLASYFQKAIQAYLSSKQV